MSIPGPQDMFNIYREQGALSPIPPPAQPSHDLPVEVPGEDEPELPINIQAEEADNLIRGQVETNRNLAAVLRQLVWQYKRQLDELNAIRFTKTINENPWALGVANKPYNAFFVPAATPTITVQIPGLKAVAMTFKVGWNVTNFPEGTFLSTAAGTSIGVYIMAGDQQFGPPINN